MMSPAELDAAGCPFIAGPACAECTGSCWDLSGPAQPDPEPCEVCSGIVGGLVTCENLCVGVDSQEEWERRTEAYRARLTESGTAR